MRRISHAVNLGIEEVEHRFVEGQAAQGDAEGTYISQSMKCWHERHYCQPIPHYGVTAEYCCIMTLHCIMPLHCVFMHAAVHSSRRHDYTMNFDIAKLWYGSYI